ncbi:DNA recombination protein RmuC [Clavibacter zhangzhiyongii]|uniref:DNA recombination protein RmuC n=1 Tax=Clavibacter zhangzhiyongii TaxID=2768071 RepID=UPI0039E0271B
MKQHVQAVRDHITALGSRAYWEGLDASPEMVIAFIPSESLVSSALEADPSIMEFAFSRRVALSSPVTLWSVLKTVAFSWQQEVLTEDAKQLFDLSRELHARLATSGEHIAKLGAPSRARSATTTASSDPWSARSSPPPAASPGSTSRRSSARSSRSRRPHASSRPTSSPAPRPRSRTPPLGRVASTRGPAADDASTGRRVPATAARRRRGSAEGDAPCP